MKKTIQSEELFQSSLHLMLGGVNSPARAFKAVGGSPLFISGGKGSSIVDADGNQYIDYVCSWGPLILGHAFPEVVRAIQEQASKGTSFGAPTALEKHMAQLIVDAVPSIEMVRMVNSGTEATMSAIRLARAYTKRNKIVKFEGSYHGHSDAFLIKAGSAALTLGVPSSPGVPSSIADMTITANYNDIEQVQKIFSEHGKDIAAVIIEPIAGNMGVIPPLPGFLKQLEDLTDQYQSLLIFDEVITGFRVAYGGAQELYGINPDLTCLGKIIGGGMPVGAYGGKREIMEQMAPVGPVFQAGTLSGNPIAMIAGITTLEALKAPGIYNNLDSLAAKLEKGLKEQANEAGIKICINREGSMMCPFFTSGQVRDFSSATTSSTDQYNLFFWEMLKQGIYFPPSQFETFFISLAHTEKDIEQTLKASKITFQALLSK